ncbi:hypothetical protein V8C42DRAFT_304258 [Trichoderma barbatum]
MAQTVQSATVPSEEEALLYYYGLPSNPRLIARSSIQPWVNPQRPESTTFTGRVNQYPRILQPVGRHSSLHELWNDGSSSLRIQILQAIGGVNWTAVDILRVGINGEFTITLMIAIIPGTLSWNDGYPITLHCKRIFQSHDIFGVECEIRESVVNFRADTTPESTANAEELPDTDTTGNTIEVARSIKMPAAFQLSSEPIPEQDCLAEYFAELSDCLGTKIATQQMDYLAGTKGLYLSLEPSSPTAKPKLLALTCRHVVISSRTEGTAKYNCREPCGPKDVIQIDQPTFKNTIHILGEESESAQGSIEKFATSERLAAPFKAIINSAASLQRAMEAFESPSSRVIGQVFFSPEFASTTDPSLGTKWLRDWALIELYPKCHQASFDSIKNKVYVGDQKSFRDLVRKGGRGLKGLTIPILPSIVDGCIELQKTVVPMDDILKPTEVSDYFDTPMMVVAKYGARGGLTLGLSSTLVSLVRYFATPDGITETISEEWAIVPVERANWRPQAAFSVLGDSGSCIWDLNKRPAGMLTAGASKNQLNDVTYAQPLERLLKDIKSCGFEVSLV